jgi:hypothetical protein
MNGDGRVSMGRHRKGGATFHSRRNKMALEREANKVPTVKRPKLEMKSDVKELFR